MENDRLWGRLVDRHHRILRSETVPIVDGDTEAAHGPSQTRTRLPIEDA